MELKSLENTPLPEIVECLCDSFSEYAIKMPTDVAYWESRYKGARVDYSLSYGAFEEGRLVAFIIQGLDKRNGLLTAFNTGTGVRAPFRGQKLVDQLYAAGMQRMLDRGVEQCQLEVLQENHRAIRVYERIGFHIQRELICFSGSLKETSSRSSIKEVSYRTASNYFNTQQEHYAWDFTPGAITALENLYKTYWVFHKDKEPIGYFTINEQSGAIAQLEVKKETDWPHLLAGIYQIRPQIKITNVDESRLSLLQHLRQSGLANPVDQHEMNMSIS